MNDIIANNEEEFIEVIKSRGILFSDIPENFKTEKIYCEWIKHDIWNFGKIPQKELTLTVILEAIKINSEFVLQHLNKEKRTPEIIKEALKSNGMVLKYIPKSEQTLEQCEIALNQKRWDSALRYVSKKLLSKELCIIAAENSGNALEYIPEKFLCNEIYQKVLPNNRFMLNYLPIEYKTTKFYNELVCNDGLALEYLPKEIITKENCYKAVEQNWKALKFVPNKFISNKLFECAIFQDYSALGELPEEKRTLDFCKKSINIDGRSLQYIPEEICTIELCLMAIKKNSNALCYLPTRFGREEEILSYERQLGLTEIVKKFYDGENFVALEKLPHYVLLEGEKKSNLLKTEFDSFDTFYEFVHEDLSGADLRRCKFIDIDLRKYEIDDCLIDTCVLIEQNIYDGLFYENNVRLSASNCEFRLSEENESSEISLRLENEDCSIDEEIIYYISDLHLDHKILKKFPHYATEKEITMFITKLVDKMVSSVKHQGKLLITGDISYQYEICKIFYTELIKKWNGFNIIVTLGNHELWDGDSTGLLENCEMNKIIKQYRDMFNELGITLLHNDLLIEQRNGIFIKKRILLHEEDILKLEIEELQRLCDSAPTLYFGGIGFSGYNKHFNANMGIYRSAIKTLEEDIKYTRQFEKIYNKIVNALSRKKVVVMTHMEKENWSTSDYQSNWIYVHGHTHKNMFEIDSKKTVYADNQIGYYKKGMGLKYFYLSNLYDIFQLYEDGKYVITREQYKDFYRGKRIHMSFSDKIGTIYMLKRCGIYCFIYSINNKLYLLDGGRKRSLNNNLDYYYKNLITYAKYINNLFKGYNQTLEIISKNVKKIGGMGKIHGCIVDIDAFNHIYLNPNDGSITAYYATSVFDKWVFPNIQALLKVKRKDLYNQYLIKRNSDTNFFQINTKEYVKNIHYVEDTFIYKPSNIIKTLQYTSFNNVVRLWNDDILKLNKKITKKKKG